MCELCAKTPAVFLPELYVNMQTTDPTVTVSKEKEKPEHTNKPAELEEVRDIIRIKRTRLLQQKVGLSA